jgi:hypothetical protein
MAGKRDPGRDWRDETSLAFRLAVLKEELLWELLQTCCEGLAKSVCF